MSAKGCDFQNADYNFIINDKSLIPHPRGTIVTDKNIVEIAIYFSVRHVIEHTWINHNDLICYPNNDWVDDKEFQTDCLIYTLFHDKK